MMVEYILGDENRFRQICGQLFGSSFDNYFNQANNTPISQQFTNISEDLLTQILTEHIKNNQLSFKDYWSSGKNIASSTNLYFNGSPVLVQSVVNAGIGAIREDEKICLGLLNIHQELIKSNHNLLKMKSELE